MYFSDKDFACPNVIAFHTELYDYFGVDNDEKFKKNFARCPGDGKTKSRGKLSYPTWSGGGLSYGGNGQFLRTMMVVGTKAYATLNRLKDLKKIFIFADNMKEGNSDSYRCWGVSGSTDLETGSSFCFRHSYRQNVILMDGHAGKIKNNGVTTDDGHKGTIIWHREEKYYPFTDFAEKNNYAGPDLGGNWGANSGSLNPPALTYLN